jgi:hypothetical protein
VDVSAFLDTHRCRPAGEVLAAKFAARQHTDPAGTLTDARRPSAGEAGALDNVERHALVQRLGQMMSDVSEDCYYAGWLGATEYLVPELCRRAVQSGTPVAWGHGVVTPERAAEMIALADRIGSWADLDEPGIGYVPFHPFPMPSEYVAAIDKENAFPPAEGRASVRQLRLGST